MTSNENIMEEMLGELDCFDLRKKLPQIKL